jgi:hypothetical protein
MKQRTRIRRLKSYLYPWWIYADRQRKREYWALWNPLTDDGHDAIEDLKKARWYIDREIQRREGDQNRLDK